MLRAPIDDESWPSCRLLAAACWLLLAAPLAADPATPRPHFERLTNEDGLSQNTVFAIEQDRQGFMWFGTKVGLNRYDGYTFKVYTHDPLDQTTLADGFVRVLAEDPDGILWIGTYGSGLDRFDPATETFTHYRPDPDDPASLAHEDVRALYVDRAGTLDRHPGRRPQPLRGRDGELHPLPARLRRSHEPEPRGRAGHRRGPRRPALDRHLRRWPQPLRRHGVRALPAPPGRRRHPDRQPHPSALGGPCRPALDRHQRRS